MKHQKHTSKDVKNHSFFFAAVCICAALIGFTSASFEREVMAYEPASVNVPKLSKIEPIKAIAKQPEVVNLLSKNPKKEVEIREAAKKACTKKNLGEQCIKDLLGIALWETRGSLNCDMVGDHGQSHGCWQINRHYHPEISPEQARDSEFASKWVLNRLMAYSYPEYRSYSIRKHNGSANNPATLAYLQGVNSYVK